MEMSSGDEVITANQLQGLQGLPEELLDAVLSQLDGRSRRQVFRTSKFLATALLQKSRRLKLIYSTQCDIFEHHHYKVAPFLTEVLQNRQQPKLRLTLQLSEPAEPDAAVDATHLLARMLAALPLCGAVDYLIISWQWALHLPWRPDFSAALAASFPSLTSLTLRASISTGHLANAISHPLLVPRLRRLDIVFAYITHEGQLDRSPFLGSRLQELFLSGWVEVGGKREFLTGLVPFPPTLTQLQLTGCTDMEQQDWVRLAAVVSSLTHLQQLRLNKTFRSCPTVGPGLMALLPALAHLPFLHTLVVDDYVVGQEQLDALLELTQITSLELHAFSGLTSSRASSDCSWRELTVTVLDWVTAAYLPLHSLTHPLHLFQLANLGIEPSIEELAAAELNLCERNKAGLELVLNRGIFQTKGFLCLSKATVDQLIEQYLSHSRRVAPQPLQPLQPIVASSSSHSGPSTNLASSSSSRGPGSNIGPGAQQGRSETRDQALMQRLGLCVRAVHITVYDLSEACLSLANQQALAVLFPTAKIGFVKQR